ncbi:MAG: gamma-glutamyltransferase, partial [Nannocystaceae bacterium]
MAGAIAAGNIGTCRAGISTLRAGGNAVDAAIAAVFASYVCEPLLSSAGGGGLMLLKPMGEAPSFVDFFPRAPQHPVTRDAHLDFRAVDIDFGETVQRFHIGRASVAVPISLEVLADTHRRWGKLSLSDVLAPAIEFAEEGHRLGASGAEVFQLLWPIVSHDPRTISTLTNGAPPTPDELLRNPQFGQFLRDYARQGQTPAYTKTAILNEFGRNAGGLVSEEDLSISAPSPETLRETRCDQWRVWTVPKPGGRALLDILTACDACPDDETQFALGLATAVAHADPSLRDTPTTRGSTTHISVVDQDGFTVSVTTSNGEGCGYILGDTGIFMNNFLGEEDLNPGGFFLHPAGAMLPTMMAPTIACAPDDSLVVLGSGGANRIRSAISSTLLRLMHGATLDDAIMAPRIHAEGSTVWLESN